MQINNAGINYAVDSNYKADIHLIMYVDVFSIKYIGYFSPATKK